LIYAPTILYAPTVEKGSCPDLITRRGLFHHLNHVATSTSTRQLKIEEPGFA
jgi:hypothetical protein